jgi:phenylpropionate dioxygenase-like ring-hydroxylating dioxygenase large terminal subunit
MITQNPDYFDSAVFEKEKAIFFNKKQLILGHIAQAAAPKDYFVPPHLDKAIALVHGKTGIKALFNTCRHRQSTLLEGKGKTGRIVCPVHAWAYGLDGELLACPGFEKEADRNLFEIDDVHSWNGIVARGFQDTFDSVAQHDILKSFDFSAYQYLDHYESHYPINWKEYADLFLDNNHINYFHPGLRALVDTKSIEWFWGENYSIHSLRFNERWQKASAPFLHYLNTYLKHFPDIQFEYGAIWLVIYPNIYIEIWQDFLSISILSPTSGRTSRNDEYILCHPRVADKPDLLEAFAQAFNEVEDEDVEILKKVARGRQNLYDWQLNDAGPFQLPMEAGVKHFQEWWKRKMS